MTICNVCNTDNIVYSKYFKKYPLTNLYLDKPNLNEENLYDFCINNCYCGHVFSISEFKTTYTENYHYNSDSTGVQLRRARGLSLLENALKGIELNCCIDIGGGNLAMIDEIIQKWKPYRSIVIDPIPLNLNKTLNKDIEYINEFFNGNNIFINHNEKPSLFILDNVLEHIDDIDNFLKGLINISSTNDLVYVCVPSLESIIIKMQFQELIHEHINYFSINVLANIFNKKGFEIIFSNTAFDGHRVYNYLLFRRIKNNLTPYIQLINTDFETSFNNYEKILNITNEQIDHINSEIYGVCASELTPTLAYHMKSDLGFCKFIFDSSLNKVNKYMPFVKPQIHNFNSINAYPKDSFYFITAPLIGKQVISNLNFFNINNVILSINII